MEKKKVLYYCSWGGFGHIARAFSVLKYMDWADVLVCSPQPWIFDQLPNVTFKPLTEPKSLIYLKDGKISRKDYGDIDDTLGYRKFLSEYIEALNEFNPDLVIADITSEIALVSQLMGYKTFIVYETLQTEDLRWTLGWNSADKVIVPYPEVFASDLGYAYADHSIFAGGYSRFEGNEKPQKSAVRQELGLSEENQMFLITMGKARMGESVVEQIIAKIADRPNSKLFMPYYNADEWSNQLESRYTNLTVITQETNLSKYFAAADMVLSGAGYNSMMEIFEFRVPAIFFPLERIHGEQINKAQTAHRLGACEYIELSQENWIDLLENKINFLSQKENIDREIESQAKIVDGHSAKRLAEEIRNYMGASL